MTASDFVADASHELRTPLTSILANLELLEAELAGEQRDMAESALRSSKRMRRLVGDLLLLARADAGRDPRGAVDLAAVAARGRERRAPCRRDPLSLDFRGRYGHRRADDLHRLAGNLIENALIHTRPAPVTVSVRRDGRLGGLEVADRGPESRTPARARLRALRPRRHDAARAAAAGWAWRSSGP